MISTPPLSLHHLTLLDASHATLIDIAANEGCDHICIFVNVPADMRSEFPVVEGEASARELRQRMDDRGVALWNLEAFHINPSIDPGSLRPTLELGAIVGARGATAINADPDPSSAADWLARFAQIADEYELVVGLEWIKPSATKTLPAAVELVRRCGAENVKLTVDPLHLFRNGGNPSDLRAIPVAMIGYVQLCDGPTYLPEEAQWAEMIGGRMMPGEGEFPLLDFLTMIPAIPVLAIEVPQRALHGTIAPAQRAATAVAATRKLLSTVVRE